MVYSNFIATTEMKNQENRVHNCGKVDRKFNFESNCCSQFEKLTNDSSRAVLLPVENIESRYVTATSE